MAGTRTCPLVTLANKEKFVGSCPTDKSSYPQLVEVFIGALSISHISVEHKTLLWGIFRDSSSDLGTCSFNSNPIHVSQGIFLVEQYSSLLKQSLDISTSVVHNPNNGFLR
jgi:hypothetical protein